MPATTKQVLAALLLAIGVILLLAAFSGGPHGAFAIRGDSGSKIVCTGGHIVGEPVACSSERANRVHWYHFRKYVLPFIAIPLTVVALAWLVTSLRSPAPSEA